MKLIKYVIQFAIMLVMSVAIILTKIFAEDKTIDDIFIILTDAFTAPGIIFLCVGILVFCSNEGTFDMLGYGIHTVFSVFKKDPTERKYKNYYDYKTAKASKQKSYTSLLISGAIYLAIGIIFFVIYKCL